MFHSVCLFFAVVFTCSNKSKTCRTINLKAGFCRTYGTLTMHGNGNGTGTIGNNGPGPIQGPGAV